MSRKTIRNGKVIFYWEKKMHKIFLKEVLHCFGSGAQQKNDKFKMPHLKIYLIIFSLLLKKKEYNNKIKAMKKKR